VRKKPAPFEAFVPLERKEPVSLGGGGEAGASTSGVSPKPDRRMGGDGPGGAPRGGSGGRAGGGRGDKTEPFSCKGTRFI
jgi:hypothetical protein